MLTFDEYLKLDDRCEEYIRGFLNEYDNIKVVASGFMEWDTEEAFRWAGPWSGRYVLAIVKDHSLEYELRTMDERKAMNAAYNKYCIYNFPHRLHSQVDLIVYVDGYAGTKCQRSALTHIERASFLTQMSQDELFAYEAKIMQATLDLFQEGEGDAYVEKPIRIHLAGNDDCSHSATFATREEALGALADIEANPTFETLTKYNFIFTN